MTAVLANPSILWGIDMSHGPITVSLTMRLSDADMRRHESKALYVNHRLPPWPTEAAAHDRSNRLLGRLD